MPKNIVILGSTGSIGRQSLDVARWFPECFRVVGLAANHNIDLLEQQTREFAVPTVSVTDKQAAVELTAYLADTSTRCLQGKSGMLELSRLPEADLVLVAVSGMVGLPPTLEAIDHHKIIALANKETLVAGGALVMEAANRQGVTILPVDSEHSAIFQCLDHRVEFDHLILTGSGGPFRGYTREQLEMVTPELALRHPTWEMGHKVTVDSATLMNKGLEVIEAHWLFGVNYERIQVVIHPQSIVHSLVAFQDSAVLAQLGCPDMRVPIQYALMYPDRPANGLEHLDLAKLGQLTFEEPRPNLFPCLRLAGEAGRAGQTMPAVLNAADEVAVQAFLDHRLPFTGIPEIIQKTMDAHEIRNVCSLEDILAADSWSRHYAASLIESGH